MNTIGTTFRLTIFGSSHGAGVGCVLDGVPPGMVIDIGTVQREVDLRRPSAGIGTPRTGGGHRRDRSPGSWTARPPAAPITLFIAQRDRDSDKYKTVQGRAAARACGPDRTCRSTASAHDIRGRRAVLRPDDRAAGGGRRHRQGAAGRAWHRDRRLYPEHRQGGGRKEARPSKTIVSIARGNDVRAAIGGRWPRRCAKEILEAGEDGDSVGGVVHCIVRWAPGRTGRAFLRYGRGRAVQDDVRHPGGQGHRVRRGLPGGRHARLGAQRPVRDGRRDGCAPRRTMPAACSAASATACRSTSGWRSSPRRPSPRSSAPWT